MREGGLGSLAHGLLKWMSFMSSQDGPKIGAARPPSALADEHVQAMYLPGSVGFTTSQVGA